MIAGRKRTQALLALLATASLAACAVKPEELVRRAIRSAVEAAEQDRFEVLRDAVSERYSDADGNTLETLVETARSYIERNRPIHVFTGERSLVRVTPDRIEVELVVAVASTPIEALRDVARLGGDAGIVELTFEEESDGAWRLASASWRPVTAQDFLR
jgi:hypothetical protein